MAEEKISGVVITFFSTASAVGKTLISINMASELARQGYHVCLVDYDLQFGDVANYLKLPVEHSVYDALAEMKKIQKRIFASRWSNIVMVPFALMYCQPQSFWISLTIFPLRPVRSLWRSCGSFMIM